MFRESSQAEKDGNTNPLLLPPASGSHRNVGFTHEEGVKEGRTVLKQNTPLQWTPPE